MNNSTPDNLSESHNGVSPNANDDEIVSIVPQAPRTDDVAMLYDDEAYAVFEPSRPSNTQDRPQWIDSLLTPWGVGAMLLILLANTLLSWAKWMEPSFTQTPLPTPSVNAPTPSQLPLEKTATLSLDSLSTTPPPKAVKKVVNNKVPVPAQPKRVAVPKPPAKPVAVKPKTDLTSALLPPAVQPQFIPVQNIPQPPSPTVLIQQPTPPVSQPTAVQVPATNTVDPATMRMVNERTLEEMRLREEERRNMPFIQKAKAQKQAIQTRQSLNQVLDNMEQQPQQPVIPIL